MNTKKFIEQVISGDLDKNGVLEFASHVKRDYNGDIQALADDLLLLSQGALLYGRTQAVSDSEEIDRLEKAASFISEAYGLDWMEAGTPTLQELLNRKEWICQKLECLEALELGSDAIGKLVASKPELAELMDRIQAVSKGVSDTTGEPRDTKAAMRLYQEQLAEITAEIEQARQQEAERAAAEPGTEQEDTECPGNRHRCFDTSFATSQQRYKTYSDLLNKGFIDKETTLDQWNAVCGIGDKTPAEVGRINWVDLPLYLATFIHNYWIVPRDRKIQNRNHCKWKIAQNCFTVCGEEINKDSTKNTLSRSNNKGEDSNRTTEILKIASQ